MLFLLIGTSIFSFIFYEDYTTVKTISSINTQLLEQVEENKKIETTNKNKAIHKPINISDLQKEEKINPLMDTISIDGQTYIGYLNIPELNLTLPIISDYDDITVETSPSRYTGTINNKMVIAGHNYKRHFAGLHKLTLKDVVSFTDVNGQEFNYEIQFIEVLEPHQIEEMIDTNFDLTLFTCTNNGSSRLVLRLNEINNL